MYVTLADLANWGHLPQLTKVRKVTFLLPFQMRRVIHLAISLSHTTTPLCTNTSIHPYVLFVYICMYKPFPPPIIMSRSGIHIPYLLALHYPP